MVVTIAGSTEDGDKVVGLKIKLSSIQTIVNNITIGKEGYVFLIDKNNAYMAHPTEKIGEIGTENYIQQMKLKENGTFTYTPITKRKNLLISPIILLDGRLPDPCIQMRFLMLPHQF